MVAAASTFARLLAVSAVALAAVSGAFATPLAAPENAAAVEPAGSEANLPHEDWIVSGGW
ncbi:hypothetical protein PYCCODRAFT_1441010 [Trametes coccinea BRFM310]|uniref:Uncharacterized protein n=1 Tax=Trametes coccinea (strain BRFM310) TaxID=1353009 RepID=A0A1Y2I5U3_TRAC3|nr:hypothetical protein PYCCODRAFT_1441010 [Trametes coccinea BRFM310]